MDLKVTIHGEERTKRLVPSKKLSKRLAEKALTLGIKTSETTGNLKKFIDYLYFYNKTANNIRIYNQKVFIFHNNTLITILNLPYRFHRTVENIKDKRKITSEASSRLKLVTSEASSQLKLIASAVDDKSYDEKNVTENNGIKQYNKSNEDLNDNKDRIEDDVLDKLFNY